MCGRVAIRNLLLEATTLFCFGERLIVARYRISRKGHDTGAVSRSVLSILQDHRGPTDRGRWSSEGYHSLEAPCFCSASARDQATAQGISWGAGLLDKINHHWRSELCCTLAPPKTTKGKYKLFPQPFSREVPQVPGSEVARQNARSFEAKALSASAKGHWRNVLCCDSHLQSHWGTYGERLPCLR